MNADDFSQLQADFENLKRASMLSDCEDGSCATDEPSREDYPDYLRAIYSEIMPPVKSGIYFSRWDLKRMAEGLDESFAIDVRERMFQKFMQWIATPEDMLNVIKQFNGLIDLKCDKYREYSENFPATKEIFDKKIQKAQMSKKYLDKVYNEFFT